MRWISRWVKAAAAALLLLAAVIGPPWALVRFIGNPWPVEGVSLSAPFTDGAIIGLLAAVIWVLWAQLMVCVLVEAIAALSADRIQLRAPLTLGVQQQFARRLVTAIIIATVTTPVALGGTANAASSGGPAPTGHEIHTELTVQTPGAEQDKGPHQRGHGRSAGEQAVRNHHVRNRSQAEKVRNQTVTVMRLDTLMDIAERVLDDPNRWEEIASLNEGQTMNDGTVFHAADYIRPGWTLLAPGYAGAGEGSVVVKPNQTLSEIALVELDDATRYPEIVAASTGIVQPDGDRLIDPDHIEPGWILHLPDNQPSNQAGNDEQGSGEQGSGEQGDGEQGDGEQGDGEQGDGQEAGPEVQNEQPPPAEDPDAGHTDDTSPEQQPSTPSDTAPAVPDTPARAEVQDVEQDDLVTEDEDAWPVRTTGGVCALLAGALVALIMLRRGRQRRLRRPGQQLPLPGVEAERIEREFRAVADDIGIAVVDVALRGLAVHFEQTGQPQPQLVAARMTGSQLDVYFAADTDLPAPWTATEDPTVWVLPADRATELEETAAEAVAPYPALVSVGHDADEGVIMLNLAHLGSLCLTGAPALTEEAITAMALELGTAPWAEKLPLTVIGSMAELSDALERRRVRYVPTPSGVRPAVYGKTHVVLAAVPLDSNERRELRGLGATLVTREESPDQSSEWRLELVNQDHATVQPLGLVLRPQLVDHRTYRGVLEVLTTSQATPDQGHITGYVRQAPVEHVVPFDPVPTASESPPAATTTDDDQTPPGEVKAEGTRDLHEAPSYDVAEPADRSTVGQSEPQIDVVDNIGPSADAQEADPVGQHQVPPAGCAAMAGAGAAAGRPVVHVDEPASLAAVLGVHPLLRTNHPVIRLLGPTVDIIGAVADAPTSESHKKVCTRLATYLALNPNSSRPALTHAVWGGQRIDRGTVDSRISNLRQWLGSDPVTKQHYLPVRTLRFTESVTTDWQVFTDLVGNDPTAASTTALEDALSLVRGRPLEDEESKHYGFAEYALEGIITQLVDTAYELARRRYMDGKWTKAAQTAALGVRLDPGNEHLWRLRIHAVHSAGNHHQVAEAIDRMHARITELGFALEPETTALLHALDQHDASTIEQSREAL